MQFVRKCLFRVAGGEQIVDDGRISHPDWHFYEIVRIRRGARSYQRQSAIRSTEKPGRHSGEF